MINKTDKEQIYLEYKDKLNRYFSGKVNSRQDAEDLTQSVFLKVYSKLDSFDESKASLSTWIYTIARNTVTDFYRQNRSFEELSEEYPEQSGAEASIELLDELASALYVLDERSRDLIILHYYDGIKLKEIAEKLNISYAYAKTLHKNALNKMKTFLT